MVKGEARETRERKTDREDESREQADPEGEHAMMVGGSCCKDGSAIAWIAHDRVIRKIANKGAMDAEEILMSSLRVLKDRLSKLSAKVQEIKEYSM